MENEINNTHENDQLCLDNNVKTQLSGAKKWSYIFSIILFVGLGLSLLLFFIAFIFSFGKMGALGGAERFIYLPMLLYILVMFFPVYYLYRFSMFSGKALHSDNIELLTKAFRYLKKHFRYLVILMIVLMVIYVFISIFTITKIGLFETGVDPIDLDFPNY